MRTKNATKDAMTSDPLGVLRPSETARTLKMSPQTLARLRKLGTGPRWIRLGARGIGYRTVDLAEWLASL